MSHLFWCAEKKNAYARLNLIGLRCKSRLQMVTIKYRPMQCKNNVLLLFLQDFVGRIAIRKNPVKHIFLNILLFLFIRPNLFFMIVKFCTYQFIEPHKFLNVGSREYRFSFKNEGSWEQTFENLRLESWNSGQNKAENAKFSNNLNGGGAHERCFDDKFRERQQAWKKGHERGTSPYHFPIWVPSPTPDIYQHLFEINNKLLCPYLILIVYTRFKTNKAKICIKIGLLRPHFCLLHKIFDVTILAKPFVFRSLKHCEILSWPPTCPAMYEVMRSFGAIKTKTHLPFAFDAMFRVCKLLVQEYAA